MKTLVLDRFAARTSAVKAGLVLAALLAVSVPRGAVAREPLEPPPPVRQHRSKGMMIAGIVLTSIGSAALVSGGVLTGIGASSHSEGGGILMAFFGMPLIVGSVVFAGV